MALQNYVDYVGPKIKAAWLNAVDKLKFTVFDDADTKVEARAALTADLPLEVYNGGTASRTPAGALQSLQVGGVQTAEEAAEGVVPTDYSYPPGDVRRYGAVGDGLTDDYVAIQAALDTGHPVIFQPVTYYVETGLTWDIDYGVIHANGAKITTDQDVIGFQVGILGSNNRVWGPRIYGNLHLLNTGTSTKQGFLLNQVYEGWLEISATDWEVGIELAANATGCVYNAIYPGRIWNCNYGIYLHPTASGWVNENNFYGGRFSTSTGATKQWLFYMPDSGSTYGRPDNNKIYGPSFEPTGNLQGYYYDGGVQNVLFSPRGEGGTHAVGKFYIADTAICAEIMWPYSQFLGSETAYQSIFDNGMESKIFALDQMYFQQKSSGTTTALYIGRSDANGNATPTVQFTDAYSGSQPSQVLKLETGRGADAAAYLLEGVAMGSVVTYYTPLGLSYECILAHTSAAADEPGVGANWQTYWRLRKERYLIGSSNWSAGQGYVAAATKFKVNGLGQITTQYIHQQNSSPTVDANYIGELHVDTNANKLYFAYRVGNGAGDWKLITSA